jgi:hypothetical protein
MDLIAYLRTHPLVQPDQTSCGSATLVIARMTVDQTYAAAIIEGPNGDPVTTPQSRFAAEAVRTHEATNAIRDQHHGLQLPWPKRLGTLPWSVARHLARATSPMSGAGSQYRVVLVNPLATRAGYDRIVAASESGQLCPLFIGNRVTPRHVVLVLPSGSVSPTDSWSGAGASSGTDSLSIYEPSAGVLTSVSRAQFVKRRLGLAGWDQPWLAVLPR